MLIVVVGLLVGEDGSMLVQQRPEGSAFEGAWEFPGGKVEDGETMREALAREWSEELDLDVDVGALLDEQIVPFEGAGNVLLPLFEVSLRGEQSPRPMIGQNIAYVTQDRLSTLSVTPTMPLYADALRQRLSQHKGM